MAKRKKQPPRAQLSLDDALSRFSAIPAEAPGPGRSPFDLAKSVSASLDGSSLSWEERIQVIGGAFVLEALRAVWHEGGGSADAAHAVLRRRDPELAAAVEALAPMLFGRHTAVKDSLGAIDEVERLIRAP